MGDGLWPGQRTHWLSAPRQGPGGAQRTPGDDPEHVLFEHVVGKGRMDIALRTGGRMVAFIEAKAPGKSLGDHVTQMLNYAFLAGVDICVLTTGLEWWLFLPLEKVPPMDRRFAVLKIAKGSAREFAGQMLRFLGREALAGRDAERRAKEALTALRHEERLKKEVPRVWREMTAVADPEKPSPVGPPPEPETGPTKQRRAPAPIRSYRLWGSKTAVKTWKDMLVGVFVALHTRHEVEFLTTARPLWGKHRPWVSNDLGELHEPRIVGQTGLYAETHLSAKAIQRRCHRLLHAFGYPDGDLEVLQD